MSHTGVLDTLTSTSGDSENKARIKDDFPTLLRPMKHTCRRRGRERTSTPVHLPASKVPVPGVPLLLQPAPLGCQPSVPVPGHTRLPSCTAGGATTSQRLKRSNNKCTTRRAAPRLCRPRSYAKAAHTRQLRQGRGRGGKPPPSTAAASGRRARRAPPPGEGGRERRGGAGGRARPDLGQGRRRGMVHADGGAHVVDGVVAAGPEERLGALQGVQAGLEEAERPRVGAGSQVPRQLLQREHDARAAAPLQPQHLGQGGQRRRGPSRRAPAAPAPHRAPRPPQRHRGPAPEGQGSRRSGRRAAEPRLPGVTAPGAPGEQRARARPGGSVSVVAHPPRLAGSAQAQELR